MAFVRFCLLSLLIACCFAPTIARTLDFSQDRFLRTERYPHPSEDGHHSDEDAPIHSSVHEEEIFIKPVLHDDKMSGSSSYEEKMSLPSWSQDDDIFLDVSGSDFHDAQDIPSLLDQNGLPIGLLPSSVASYSITDDGEFAVLLEKPCYVKFDYEVYYAHTITGKLSYGTITGLSGIQAKEAFFWVPVTGIRADIPSSRYIYFDVGPISKKLSISQFETIPVCKAKVMALSTLL